MGLLDRLQAARSQVTGETVATQTSVEHADTVEAAPAAKPAQEWGKPGRCPECDGRGYLDHIDLVDRIMYQHCTECRHQWTVNERELAARS